MEYDFQCELVNAEFKGSMVRLLKRIRLVTGSEDFQVSWAWDLGRKQEESQGRAVMREEERKKGCWAYKGTCG